MGSRRTNTLLLVGLAAAATGGAAGLFGPAIQAGIGSGVASAGGAISGGLKAVGLKKSIGTIASIAGTLAKAGGELEAGEQQFEQGQIEAGLAETQAIAEETRAAEERTETAQLETERRKEGRRDVARVVSRTAGSGFELAGTPLLQISDFLTDIEADVSNINITGKRKAGAAESRAVSRRLQGLTLEEIGRSKRTQARFAAGSSLLTGIGGIFT